MPRPFNRRQQAQNRAFLDALARTGNARLAAAELGVHRSTYLKRRARCPAFAAQWDAALVTAHARFPRSSPRLRGEGDRPKGGGGAPSAARAASAPLRTSGGEPVLVRLKSGRVQLRRARPGRMTKAAEQAFLRALSACANVRLAAAAAGFAHSSFYARARASPAFAREMRLALAEGYDRLEAALLAAELPESGADGEWRSNDPPPIPRMTPGQALQLLFLHEKSVRQGWDQPHRRRRRGESDETHRMRLRAMWLAEQARARDEEALRRALEADGCDDLGGPDAPAPPPLPDLEQVTGWSKAKGAPAHNDDLALFGGWRLKDWKARRGRP
jgi:hypothetical protein